MSHYRQDIDGLRAVAVSSVLLFHASVPGISGGFVGVDVFFVISGFLITGILHADLQSGSFSLSQFYFRRIRRIFPALYVTILLTGILGLCLFSAIDLKDLSSAIAWLAVFGSNFYFMEHSGYFDATSEQNAVLQTWSLAIEEQYYLVFPIALAGLFRLKRVSPKWFFLAVAIASLIFSIVAIDRNARTAFFSTPGRIWELMIGSCLALGIVPATASPVLRQWVSAVGMGMIAGSVILLDTSMAFPGALALPACVGTAAVIWSGGAQDTVVGRILSTRPFVFVGLISYSLYLLHWPLIVYAKYYFRESFSPLHVVAVLALAFGAAVLSWRYVERPFRQQDFSWSRQTVFGVASLLIVFTFLGGMFSAQWFGDRLSADDQLAEQERAFSKAEPCMLGISQTMEQWPVKDCAIGRAPPSFAIWGDSFAAHYFYALRKYGIETGKGGLLLSQSSCPPITGLDVPKRPGCKVFNDGVLKKLLREKPRLVMLSADWMIYEKRKGLGEVFSDKFEMLSETIRILRHAGLRVLVLGPSPGFPVSVPRIARSDTSPAGNRVAKANNSEKFDRYFRSLAKTGAIEYLPVYDEFCDDVAFCKYEEGGKLLFWDEGHLTRLGGEFVVNRLREKFPEHFGAAGR